MTIAGIHQTQRTLAWRQPAVVGAAAGSFTAIVTELPAVQGGTTAAPEKTAREKAADAVAAFDMNYNNVDHSQAEFDAYYAEGARQVSAAQGLPEGHYDFSAMSPRELRIVTGDLVRSGAIRFGDVAHLTIQLVNVDGTTPGDTSTDWYAVVNEQIANARARNETDSIPYLQSAADALQTFQTKSDRPAGAPSLRPPAPAQGSAKLDAALAAFRKEATMTPAERVRREVLKDMKLTEDALKAMPAEQRQSLEKTIAEEVARRMKARGIDGGSAKDRAAQG